MALVLLTSLAFSQPCLTGWTYRVPVLIDNSANTALSDHQIKLTLNTQELIVKGKAKLDGGDIRFLDKNGAVLPFWIDPESYNSTTSEIWIKVNSIAATSTDTIYLFYGEASSLSLSNGDLTFDIFDDFIGSTINASKWTSCNGRTFDIAGGTATFTSDTLVSDHGSIESVASINTPTIVEANVVSVSNGLAFIGQKNGAEGYGLAYEDNGQPTMRMVKFKADASCFDLANINPPNNTTRSANETSGLWSFSWFSPSNQQFSWPGQAATESRNDTEYTLPSGVTIALGNINIPGSFEVDWVRARKYLASQPSTSLGAEVTSVFSVTASAVQSTVCQLSSIELKASAIEGAQYSWTGPNAYTSTDQNPIINNVGLSAAGTYEVTADIPTGCSSASASTVVDIDPTTVQGVLSGDSTVCEANNAGTVRLNNQTGSVVKWESSPTGLAPWTTIDQTSTTLAYSDLVNTTFYRAIVKSGVCEELATDEVKVTADPITIAGRVIGSTEKCTNVNSSDLTQVEHEGEIQRWQFSTDSGVVWNDILVDDLIYEATDLSTTTWFRTEIKSGVCPAVFSDSAKVIIHPLPVVAFAAGDTCEGFASQFVNSSSIASGRIDHYEWDFSNGESSVSINPIYEFAAPGSYIVKLSAESDKGCKASNTNLILVNPLPSVSFSFENICDRNAMSFTQTSFIRSGGISSFTWDFGDESGTSSDSDPSYLFATDGTYDVKLVVASSASCTDSVTHEVTVYPRATLAFVTDSVFLGEETSFINNSNINGGNLSYEWRLGDGATSVLVSPTHAYKSAGSFTSTLISTSNFDCKDTLQQAVQVLADAQASFTVENVCQYDSASFVNTSFISSGTLSYKWNFGDGGSSILKDPKHIYATPGTYLVTVVATSNFGSESTFSDFVTIHPLPQASFAVSSVCDEVEASFSNLSSISTGTLSYEWDFGDLGTSIDKQPTHLYEGAGAYTIQLIATSGFTCKDTATVPVTVYPRPETRFSVNNACDGFPSFFKDETTITSGSITTHTWDFGDGTNSIEQNPEKQFLNPTTYQVKLITNSDKDCPNDTTITVKVVTAPVANFTFENECDGVPISFSNTSVSEEGSLIYEWSFGDGDSSTSQSPSHLYPTSGYYRVNLLASSEFGCQDSVARTIQAYPNPTPSAGEDQTVSRGFSVNLSVTGAGDFIWTPEASLDNQSSTTPIATPLETTTYLVSVTDSNSCTGSDEVTVNVDKDYIVLASNVITPDGNGINDTWFVENVLAYEDSKVVIFDRWGKRIHEQAPYLNDWVGVSNTDILPDGEYYYIITFTGSEKVYKGTITLLRGN